MTTQVDALTSQQYRDYITQQTEVASASGEFSVDDFYTLLAAQLQNQDLYNAQDDTKFLEQMVQIYNIQNMKEMSNVMAEMNEMTMTSYAFEFMGKQVTVATLDEKGELTQLTGMVEKVVLYNGTPQIYVEGQAYGLGSVMEVFPAENKSEIEELEEKILQLEEQLSAAQQQNSSQEMMQPEVETEENTSEETGSTEGTTETENAGTAEGTEETTNNEASADASTDNTASTETTDTTVIESTEA